MEGRPIGRGRGLLGLALLNWPLSMALAWQLYRPASGALGFLQFSAHFLALALAVALLALLLPLRGRAALGAGAGMFWLYQVLLLVDVKIYQLFRFHINSLVLNVLLTEGAGDSVLLGRATVAYFAATALALLALELAALRLLPLTSHVLRGRRALLVLALAALLIGADKALYAWADVVNLRGLTRASILYPLYQPLTMKRFLARHLKVRIEREEHLEAPRAGGLLRYPLRPLRRQEQAPLYNIVMVVLEGLRADMLNPRVMPHLWAFSQQALRFRRHYSSGNGSRMGIFGLLYGLAGSHWHSFLAERQGPVLLEVLKGLGYSFKVLSSTRLTFPEFRKTAFVGLSPFIEDSLKGDSAQRDALLMERLIGFLREARRPFFAFAFLNASHQPYTYPKAFERFGPTAQEEINYFKKIQAHQAALLKNRYMNALYWDDHLLGLLFESLKEEGLLKDTVVLITGDHGEEFLEGGYFGHTSSFSDYQVQVPLVLYVPGETPREVRALSSHLDVPPTLLGLLGFENPPQEYCQGQSLLGPRRRPYVVSSSWRRLCIITAEQRLVVGTGGYAAWELYDSAYRPLRLRQLSPALKAALREVLRQNTLFYR